MRREHSAHLLSLGNESQKEGPAGDIKAAVPNDNRPVGPSHDEVFLKCGADCRPQLAHLGRICSVIQYACNPLRVASLAVKECRALQVPATYRCPFAEGSTGHLHSTRT